MKSYAALIIIKVREMDKLIDWRYKIQGNLWNNAFFRLWRRKKSRKSFGFQIVKQQNTDLSINLKKDLIFFWKMLCTEKNN